MSKLYLKPKKKLLLSAMIAVSCMLSVPAFTQAPGLEFKDASLVSGTAGQDGAVYKFPNVTTNVDGYIKISGRSSAGVKLTTIDLTGTGWDKAFQPQVSYKNKNAGWGERDWWMEFEISFVSQTDNLPVSISSMDVTAIDIDGDGRDVNEWVSLYNLASYTTEQSTLLQVSDLLESILSVLTLTGKKFDGPDTNYGNIDTSATRVMTTARYTNKSQFRIRTGGHSDDRDIDAERMYSFWFKSFAYNAPVQSPLPVVLSSFTARKSSNQVLLNWNTDMEKDVSHFVVEKSLNGKDFTDAGIVFTEGNSNVRKEYNFKDDLKSITSGLVYYRLKIVDIDGRYKQSAVRIIRVSEENTARSITVYPNPAVSDVRITLSSTWQDNPVNMQVFNANGQCVLQRTNTRPGQTETINVSNLTAGMYIVKVSNGVEATTQRFIKVK
ncbi:T9SS type A sorting domain-containing protein [Niastella caeni]|nr:T9SS type A sorting domain-containing protein [Niastella caeni]